MDAEDNIYVSDEATHRITAITSEGDFLGSWGERGEGKGQLNGPSGIAFDLDGSLYVSDTLNQRVQRFTREGVFLSTWGSFGDGDGQFNMPWGVALNPVGDVYVVDWRNDCVQKFDAEGRFIHRFGTSGGGSGQFNRPAGIAVDGDGDVYVADLGNHRIQMFDRDGRYLQTFTGDGTLSKSARQYVLANAKALRLRFEANLEPEKALLGPTSLTVDPPGTHGHNRRRPLSRAGLPEGCHPSGGGADSSAFKGADTRHHVGPRLANARPGIPPLSEPPPRHRPGNRSSGQAGDTPRLRQCPTQGGSGLVPDSD